MIGTKTGFSIGYVMSLPWHVMSCGVFRGFAAARIPRGSARCV